MLFRKILLGGLATVFVSISLHAQLFETRSTRYAGQKILDSLIVSENAKLWSVRDSVLQTHLPTLGPLDVIETYFDGHYMGLVIYQNSRPHELLGFWDPNGNLKGGGTLSSGTGVVKTPFNPSVIQNFKSESVTYLNGFKNGPVFYYCDCASVLRKGTFTNNSKTGLWKEFAPSGKFIKQEEIEIVIEVSVPDSALIEVPDKWLEPAHCMMQPLDICPDPNGGSR